MDSSRVCWGIHPYVGWNYLDVESAGQTVKIIVSNFTSLFCYGMEIPYLSVIFRLSERSAISQTVGARPLSKKRSFVALGLVLLLVATVIPHQVAFVISWLMVLWTSASKSKPAASANEFASTPPNRQDSSSRDTLEPPIPLSSIRAASPSPTRRRSSPEPGMPKSGPAAVAASSPPMGDALSSSGLSNDHTLVQHVLLLQAFLLPTQAPVLAVWIRTLVTAGFTTPFDGDHNIFLAVFWLTLAEAVVNGANWQRKGSM